MGFNKLANTTSSSKSSQKKLISNSTENSNNNNVESNNKNLTIINGENVNISNYTIYPDLGVAGKPKPLTRNITFESSSARNPVAADGSSLPSVSAIHPTATEPQIMHPQHNVGSNPSYFSRPESNRFSVASELADKESLFSGVEYPLPKQITSDQLKKHLPKDTEKHIQVYMSTKLFGSKNIIPLWNPSPGIETNPREWRDHINIGDVGIFNEDGGFDTLFNIFLSVEQNYNRRYNPPDNFVHYGRNVRIRHQDVALPPSKMINAAGLADLPDESPLIGPFRHVNAAQFCALYLHSGYQSATMGQYDRSGVLEYIRHHQESWRLHIEYQFAGQLQDRPLLVILSCFRTKTCALAAGAKPTVIKSWKPKVTLRELYEGDYKSYVWETNDKDIQTKFSPSRSFRESLETYVRDMGCSTAARKELEECHCVAIGACSVQKRGWIRGGSVTIGGSSRTTVRPFSRMSLPTRFNSSMQEEIGY